MDKIKTAELTFYIKSLIKQKTPLGHMLKYAFDIILDEVDYLEKVDIELLLFLTELGIGKPEHKFYIFRKLYDIKSPITGNSLDGDCGLMIDSETDDEFYIVHPITISLCTVDCKAYRIGSCQGVLNGKNHKKIEV